MRTTFDTADAANFWSADLAIRGRRDSNDGWSHPPGSDLVAWVTSAGRSPITYLQFGDGPADLRRPVVPPCPRQRHHLGGVGGGARVGG